MKNKKNVTVTVTSSLNVTKDTPPTSITLQPVGGATPERPGFTMRAGDWSLDRQEDGTFKLTAVLTQEESE